MPTASRTVVYLCPLTILAAKSLHETVRTSHASVLSSRCFVPDAIARTLYISPSLRKPTAVEVLDLLPETIGSAGTTHATDATHNLRRVIQLRLLPHAISSAGAVIHIDLPVAHLIAVHLHTSIRASVEEHIAHKTILPSRLCSALYTSQSGSRLTA